MSGRFFDTKAIHSFIALESDPRPVISPIYLSSTYDQRGSDSPQYFYSRGENPTRHGLEATLAALEGAKFCVTFASGQAAGMAALSLLRQGDHILSMDDIYGGTYNLFNMLAPYGLTTTYADMTDVRQVVENISKNTKLIWVETPTNPLLKIVDIEKVCKLARESGALVLIDNTFCSPWIQQPLALGADIVLHSTTKYINGHMDVIGGALACNDSEIFQRIAHHQSTAGGVPSPFDCWLILRGVSTLALRMERHSANAAAIVDFLQRHPKVSRTIYPGLKSHPQYDLALKQMKSAGGIVSFEYKGDVMAFFNRLRLFSCGVSLGGIKSLIESPPLMTHRPIPREERLRRGISDNLVRIAIGIEDVSDLIEDLESAM